MTFPVPLLLQSTCQHTPEGIAWLARLPATVQHLLTRWSLTLVQVYETGATCSWVAHVHWKQGGSSVLKLGLPHMEARDELPGLRFWDGDPTVHLLAGDENLNAMLLERCEPGSPLSFVPAEEQPEVIAALLRRMWRIPPDPHAFRPLSVMLDHWSAEVWADEAKWSLADSDAGLVRAGLALFSSLPAQAPAQVMLATDLHAGNILRAQREPWLVIDPKPFVGDPAYDLTQHLLNEPPDRVARIGQTIDRLADLAGVTSERVRLWTFARAAAEPRSDWQCGGRLFALAKAIPV